MISDMSKIYEKMTAREKAEIVYREVIKKNPDQSQINKITGTVEQFSYYGLDHEFKDGIYAHIKIESYWIISWLDAVGKFHLNNSCAIGEYLSKGEDYRIRAQQKKHLADLHMWHLLALDEALIELNLSGIREMYLEGQMTARQMCELGDIEIDHEAVKASKDLIVKQLGEAKLRDGLF